MDTCIVCLAELPEKELPRNGADGLPLSYNLDDLPEFLLARLPCSHVLHNGCLKPWVERANSCPICRNTFNVVELVTSPSGMALSSYHVDDKTQAVEHNDQNMLPTGASEHDRQQPGGFSPVCFICNESGYSDLLLFCDDCRSPYHTYCLGVEAASQGLWYCPPCVLERPILASRNDRSSALARRGRNRTNFDPWERVWLTVGGRQEALEAEYRAGGDEPPEYSERNLDAWSRRIAVARRQGVADVLHEAVPRILERLPLINQEPVMTEDEKTAWAMLEEAEGSLSHNLGTATSEQNHGEDKVTQTKKRRLSKLSASSPTKAKSSNITDESDDNSSIVLPESPVQPIPERKLKRPRTRRIIQPITVEVSEPLARHQARRQSIELAIPIQSPPAPESGPSPTLLDTLLADIDKPQGSTKLALKFPHPTSISRPAFLAPLSPLTPPVDTPESFPTSPTHENPSEITLPHSPPAEVSSPALPPRQDSASPSSLSLNNKKEIERLVRSALGPHYQAGEMSSEQFADINKAVSRSLYGKLSGDGRIREWDRARWQTIARKEVEKHIEILRRA